MEGTDIAIKEARALYNTPSTFGSEDFNGRVTAFIDNSNLISFWNNEGSKSIALSNEIKDLFSLSVNLNISLRMTYVPSDSNSADSPSRFYSDLDCTLSQVIWSQVESQFGPHSFDLMATQSNVMKDASGGDLRFFSPFPMQGSSGVNMFSQDLSPYEDYYVFSPFVLTGPLFRFFQAKYLHVTFIAPDVFPRKYWWPISNAICVDRIQIRNKNEIGVLNSLQPQNLVGTQNLFHGIYILTGFCSNFSCRFLNSWRPKSQGFGNQLFVVFHVCIQTTLISVFVRGVGEEESLC